MGPEHALVIQSFPQFMRVGDWDHFFETVFKEFLQGLVTRDRRRRGVILTAKGKKELDQGFRIAVLRLVRVHVDPRSDKILSK